MPPLQLKLKQANAVLGVPPKDLRNLVQFKVLQPARRDSFYWFNNRLLLEAKVALYLKESLGSSPEVLALFTRALAMLRDEDVTKVRYLSLRSRPAKSREPIEVRIRLRDLANELQEQLPRATVWQDLPRGRKRAGWKCEFTRTLEAAAKDLSGVTESQIAEAIRGFRAERKKLPEITVAPSKKTAYRSHRYLRTRRWCCRIQIRACGEVKNASASLLRGLLEEETFTWLVTEEIFSEYKAVLGRLGVRRILVGEIINLMREEAEFVAMRGEVEVSPDRPGHSIITSLSATVSALLRPSGEDAEPVTRRDPHALLAKIAAKRLTLAA
jgi:hypothetical protein